MNPCRLFMLCGVPEDEAIEIRELLEENGIDYYEVPASFLGISPASIWLRDGGEFRRARALIDGYQIERAKLARSEYERRGGKTVFDGIRAHPVRFFVYIAAIAVILYLSLSPFLNFGK